MLLLLGEELDLLLLLLDCLLVEVVLLLVKVVLLLVLGDEGLELFILK